MVKTEKSSPWSSLEIAKLLVSLATPILICLIGLGATKEIHNSDIQRQKAESDHQVAEVRQAAVLAFSKAIFERRIRAELLNSALRRYAKTKTKGSKDEILERWRLYQNAYAEWNVNNEANMLLLHQIVGEERYPRIEELIGERLVRQTLGPLDACLTAAYDMKFRGGDPTGFLDNCHSYQMIQRTLECGYAISEELFELTDKSSTPKLHEDVDRRCPANPEVLKPQ